MRSLAGPRTRVEHVYDADGRLRATEALAELWQFREVLWAFASRTFRLRYKQTVLGVAWVVLQPLLGNLDVKCFGQDAPIARVL